MKSDFVSDNEKQAGAVLSALCWVFPTMICASGHEIRVSHEILGPRCYVVLCRMRSLNAGWRFDSMNRLGNFVTGAFDASVFERSRHGQDEIECRVISIRGDPDNRLRLVVQACEDIEANHGATIAGFRLHFLGANAEFRRNARYGHCELVL